MKVCFLSAAWLLSKYVRENTDVRVVMCGDGSDELTQGYLYFHNQPRPEDGDKESKLVKLLLLYCIFILLSPDSVRRLLLDELHTIYRDNYYA